MDLEISVTAVNPTDLPFIKIPASGLRIKRPAAAFRDPEPFYIPNFLANLPSPTPKQVSLSFFLLPTCIPQVPRLMLKPDGTG
jgi:hypothetical protein